MALKQSYIEAFGVEEIENLSSNLLGNLRSHIPPNSAIILNVSGGLDSLTCLYLLCQICDPRDIYAFHTPSSLSSKLEYKRFTSTTKQLGVNSFVIDLEELINPIIKSVETSTKTIFEPLNQSMVKTNIAFGIRELIITAFSKKFNQPYRLIGCLDKTENLTGNFPKNYCLMDLAPLLDLYRTQIRAIAEHLGIPREVVSSPADHDSLCLPVDRCFEKGDIALDCILYLAHELHLTKDQIQQQISDLKLPITLKEITFALELIRMSKHKRYRLDRSFELKNSYLNLETFHRLFG